MYTMKEASKRTIPERKIILEAKRRFLEEGKRIEDAIGFRRRNEHPFRFSKWGILPP